MMMMPTNTAGTTVACSGLAEEELNKDNQENCERLSREAEVHSNLATRVIDYGDEACPLHMLDAQVRHPHLCWTGTASLRTGRIRRSATPPQLDDVLVRTV